MISRIPQNNFPLAWLTRQGKLVPDTFPIDIAGFTDPEETPEERAEYFEQRYKNWNSEWLILKCSYKVQKNGAVAK